jgi:hypothetical protein
MALLSGTSETCAAFYRSLVSDNLASGYAVLIPR